MGVKHPIGKAITTKHYIRQTVHYPVLLLNVVQPFRGKQRSNAVCLTSQALQEMSTLLVNGKLFHLLE